MARARVKSLGGNDMAEDQKPAARKRTRKPATVGTAHEPDAPPPAAPEGDELAGLSLARAEYRDLQALAIIARRLVEKRSGRRQRYGWLAPVVHEAQMEAETLAAALRGDVGAQELRRSAKPRTLRDIMAGAR